MKWLCNDLPFEYEMNVQKAVTRKIDMAHDESEKETPTLWETTFHLLKSTADMKICMIRWDEINWVYEMTDALKQCCFLIWLIEALFAQTMRQGEFRLNH